MRSTAFVLCTVVAVAVAASAHALPPNTAPDPGRDPSAENMSRGTAPRFLYWMAPGSAPDGEGRTLPDDYAVTLSASQWTMLLGSRITSYSWRLDGEKLAAPRTWTGVQQELRLAEGSYLATLTATSGTGQTQTLAQPVIVKNIVIASIGDSYSSGEGNPDVRAALNPNPPWDVKAGATWSDTVSPPHEARYSQCHRSRSAATNVVATQVESDDARNSVTFMSFSCSGATLSNGILSRYRGVEADLHGGKPQLVPQIDQLRAALGNGTRPLDVLNVSIGGNDVGFADMVTDLILNATDTKDRQAYATKFNAALAGVYTPGPDPSSGAGATGTYVTMGDWLKSTPALKNTKVIVTAYPDILYQPGGFCPNALSEVIAQPLGRGISAFEAQWAVQTILSPLNQTIAKAVSANDKRAGVGGPRWFFVPEIENDFNGHGYCGPDTSCPCNSGTSWVRTAPDSADFEGQGASMVPVLNAGAPGVAVIQTGRPRDSFGFRATTKGTLHPNEDGHRQIARRIRDKLDLALYADLDVRLSGPASVTCDAAHQTSAVYSLTIGSRGPGTARDVHLAFHVPDGTHIQAMPAFPNARTTIIASPSRVVSFDIDEIADGVTLQGSLILRVPCGPPATGFTTTVVASSFSPDPNLTDNMREVKVAFAYPLALPQSAAGKDVVSPPPSRTK